ncbi:hypothetical protein PIB30_056307 [Stylosanthes scabra]|uniref:Uncharacterized protein n=1 Tax=Stylosanthes scabra TaxID=79078 RepID=A0ABU6QK13_9FABA|nr:hypothetical protein [Stylosanthes scabra]
MPKKGRGCGRPKNRERDAPGAKTKPLSSIGTSIRLPTIVEEEDGVAGDKVVAMLGELKQELLRWETTTKALIHAHRSETQAMNTKSLRRSLARLRKLEFVQFTAGDIDLLYSIKQKYVGAPFAYLSHRKSEMIGEEAPDFLDLTFRPPPGMRFLGTDLAVATSIFANTGKDE